MLPQLTLSDMILFYIKQVFFLNVLGFMFVFLCAKNKLVYTHISAISTEPHRLGIFLFRTF
jgi:hypothetical protein